MWVKELAWRVNVNSLGSGTSEKMYIYTCMNACVSVCIYVYLSILLDKSVSRSRFIYTGESTSIYLCLVPEVTASIWIAYN